MKSSWEKIKMRKIADLNPYKITKEFRFETIEYLDISSVGSGYITKPKIMKLSEAPSRAKRLVNDGNIILSTVRPNRRSFYFFKHAKDNLVVSTGFAVLQAKKKVIPKFLYYLINDYKFTGYLTKSAKGSAYPAVDEEIINNAILSIPKELKEQRKITSILSAYDELIENNNRRIGILEEMAETIYKEWFVHFRYPGHEKDKMVDSELGKIPESWEVKTIKEVLSLEYGKGLPKKIRKPGNVPVYGSSGFVGYHNTPLVNGPGIIIGRAGNAGKIHWVDEDFYPVDSTFYVNIHDKNINLFFMFYTLQRMKISRLSSSSAVPGVNRNAIYNRRIIIPNSKDLLNFEKNIYSVFSIIFCLKKKNLILKKSRDLLLPKLISGKIDVSDLDIKIEEKK